MVVTGGSGSYTFSWENSGSTDSVRTGLVADTYKVYVNDGVCLDSLTFFLSQPAAIANISIDPTNESCSGANDGQIAISGVTGGAGSYEYSIDNGFTYQSDSTFANLAAGSYQVKVRDANACESDAVVVDISGLDCPILSGTIRWEHNNAGVEAAVVDLTGDATGNTLTDNLGAYSFEVLSGNYQITPTKSDSLLNGVTVTDVMIIQEHVTFVNPITDPYKLIAADVNQSNSISTLDALIIAQTILGNPTAEALFLNSWRFVDAGYDFPNPLNPWGFPESISLVGVAADQGDLDFVGVKMGDLDGTASPSSLWAEDVQSRNNDPVLLQWLVAEQPLLNPGEVLELPFYAGQFEQLLAYQFGLRYEQSHLELLDVVPGTALNLQVNNFGSYEPGQLRSLWWHSGTEAAPSLDVDMPVFTLRFKVLRRGNRLSDYLYLDETVLRDEVRDASFSRGRVELQFQQAVSVMEWDASASTKLYQNVPNPFDRSTVIGFRLPEASKARLSILDVNGKVLRIVEGDYAAGYNEVRVSDLKVSGLLYYRLETPTHNAVRSMMVVE